MPKCCHTCVSLLKSLLINNFFKLSKANLKILCLNENLSIVKNKKNKNTFISEKKCNIIIIFIKYVTYNSFLETAIMGSAA